MKRPRLSTIILFQVLWVHEIYPGFVESYRNGPIINRKPPPFRATDGDADTTIDTEYSVKLQAEATAPFRLFRTFVYGALGAAAGLGTLTTIPQLVRQLSDHSDTHPTLINLAVNAGGLLTTGFLLRGEENAENKLRRVLSSKQALSDNKLNPAQVLNSEQQLMNLPVQIQVSETNENVSRIVSLDNLLKKGKQRVIIVAGVENYVRDAIIAARLVDGSTFTSNDITIIPFVYDGPQVDETTTKSPLMREAFFARPRQLNAWRSILQKEVDSAARQQQRDSLRILEKGITLAIDTQGKVVRRGLGAPVWIDVGRLFTNIS